MTASMSSQDLGLWLQEQGIPNEFCEKFEGAYLVVLARKETIRASYNKEGCGNTCGYRT